MDMSNIEIDFTDELVETQKGLHELGELHLALVGGGIGDVIVG
jgi:hypothetical protein